MRTDRHTDRRMDRETNLTKLIVYFRNFANAPINQRYTTYNARYNRLNVFNLMFIGPCIIAIVDE